MKKPRISTQEIAEIIVERFEEMKSYTERIEKVADTTLDIDVTNMEKLVSNHRDFITKQLDTEKRILSQLEAIVKQNETRLPNWMLICLFVAYFALLLVFVYVYNALK